MVGKAIAALNERGGSSRQAILKYFMANFNVGKDDPGKLYFINKRVKLREKIYFLNLRRNNECSK